MLTQEPTTEDPSPIRSHRRLGRATVALLVAAVVLVLILRHDYWQWTRVEPLLFGFLPVGLWWQGLVSILATLMMWLLVHFAWPGHVEEDAIRAERLRVAGRLPSTSSPHRNSAEQ